MYLEKYSQMAPLVLIKLGMSNKMTPSRQDTQMPLARASLQTSSTRVPDSELVEQIPPVPDLAVELADDVPHVGEQEPAESLALQVGDVFPRVVVAYRANRRAAHTTFHFNYLLMFCTPFSVNNNLWGVNICV